MTDASVRHALWFVYSDEICFTYSKLGIGTDNIHCEKDNFALLIVANSFSVRLGQPLQLVGIFTNK